MNSINNDCNFLLKQKYPGKKLYDENKFYKYDIQIYKILKYFIILYLEEVLIKHKNCKLY